MPKPSSRPAVISGLLALALSGCGTTGPGDSLAAQLALHGERWASTAPTAYVYAVRRGCFCPMEAIGPVRMEVVDGAVVSAVYVDGGAPVGSDFVDLFPTVSGLFDVLADALDRDADRIEVSWDEETGIPLELFIDYEENAADEELGFQVTEMPTPIER